MLILCPPSHFWRARTAHRTPTVSTTGVTSPIHNLLGWPGVSLRAGTSAAGLPVGVQVVAPPWREDLALALARASKSCWAASTAADLGGIQRLIGAVRSRERIARVMVQLPKSPAARRDSIKRDIRRKRNGLAPPAGFRAAPAARVGIGMADRDRRTELARLSSQMRYCRRIDSRLVFIVEKHIARNRAEAGVERLRVGHAARRGAAVEKIKPRVVAADAVHHRAHEEIELGEMAAHVIVDAADMRNLRAAANARSR